jgi:regulatory protein YycI of two-component signal transduction system YycFG
VQKKLLGITFRALIQNRERKVGKNAKIALATRYLNLCTMRRSLKAWKQKYFSISGHRSAQELAMYIESSRYKGEYYQRWKRKQRIAKSKTNSALAAASHQRILVMRRHF